MFERGDIEYSHITRDLTSARRWGSDGLDWPSFVRKMMAPKDIMEVADRVRAGACVCCPDEVADVGMCGHRFCALCMDRGHDGDNCLACALAV